MKSLPPNWFFEDIPDLEYKKYILLAWLQQVQKDFAATRLYPSLSELVFQFRNLSSFQQHSESLFATFPAEISEVDWKNVHIEFRKTIANDELMEHLMQVVSFSVPEIRKHIDEGKAIYDFVEEEMDFEPVGILPLYKQEGYMFLHTSGRSEINVYEYDVRLIEHHQDGIRAVHTSYITSYDRSMVNTSQNIKIDLVRNRAKLPNPATFDVVTNYTFPEIETVLPVAKRMLMRFID